MITRVVKHRFYKRNLEDIRKEAILKAFGLLKVRPKRRNFKAPLFGQYVGSLKNALKEKDKL